MTIAAIILAAGESARLGFPKQLVRQGGQTLLKRAAQSALSAGCAPVIVVLGAHVERVRNELGDMPVHVAVNGNWRAGMGSSIHTGMQALNALWPDAEAAILSVCDQPQLGAAQFEALQAQYRKTGKPVVASAYAGSLGVPALFERSLFAELMGLQDGAGAKSLIARHSRQGGQGASVDFPGGEIDIDTPADLAAAAHPPAA